MAKHPSVHETVERKARFWDFYMQFKAGGRDEGPACLKPSTLSCRPPAASPQLLASGERDKLKRLARERLEEAGWTEDVKQLCRGERHGQQRAGQGAAPPSQARSASGPRCPC